jgi:putative inorganic carbon (HCO3(-)) transporter
MRKAATKIHTALFYTLIFLLPLNLGKHFITENSYVSGFLVDYLVPTIYLVDLLILLLLIFWAISLRKYDLKMIDATLKPSINLLFLFVFVVFLSVLGSVSIQSSLHYFFRLLLYVFLFIYVAYTLYRKRSFYIIFSLLSISVFLLAILGIAQWLNQSAIFQNYLFFGEQPYTDATPGIHLESVFGVKKVPPYGLFRHPNTFGGFLSILLLWILFYFVSAKNTYRRLFLAFTLLLGTVALFLTFSAVSLFAYIFGLVLLLGITLFGNKAFVVGLAFAVLLAFFAFFVPFFAKDTTFTNPSIYRRVNYSIGSVQIYTLNPLFGTGVNTNPLLIEHFSPKTRDLRFVQPVHNIFLLILSEVGVFALFFFVFFLWSIVWSLHHTNIFGISILQFLILGSFDHYLLTNHQAQILFWLTLGLALAYNFITYAKQN